jgi:hypothetical protein
VLDAGESGRWAVWIGRRCFPYPAVLVRRFGNGCEKGVSHQHENLSHQQHWQQAASGTHSPKLINTDLLLQRSLFVAPRSPADRLWAIDLALRSPVVSVVVADGSDLDMAATRRIQLVAKNHESQAFFIRPPWEQSEPSAAYSRWLVRNAAASHGNKNINPVWTVELLRCKGVHWGTMANIWSLEWNRVECTLHPSSALADSAGAAPTTANAERDDRPRRRLASG